MLDNVKYWQLTYSYDSFFYSWLLPIYLEFFVM